MKLKAAKTMNATRGHLKTLVGTACAFVIRAEDKKRGHEVPSGEVLTVTMENFDFAWGLVKQIDPAEFEKKKGGFKPLLSFFFLFELWLNSFLSLNIVKLMQISFFSMIFSVLRSQRERGRKTKSSKKIV